MNRDALGGKETCAGEASAVVRQVVVSVYVRDVWVSVVLVSSIWCAGLDCASSEAVAGLLCAGGVVMVWDGNGVAVKRHCGSCNQPFTSPADCRCACHDEARRLEAEIVASSPAPFISDRRREL